MTLSFRSELERLEGLTSIVSSKFEYDFNSPQFDSINMLEDQLNLVIDIIHDEKLTSEEKRYVNRLIIIAQFLITQ